MNLVLITRFKGGPGSGHFGHAGRPGLRGGSLPGNVAMSVRTGMAAAMRKGWVPEPKEALESAESSKSSAKGPRVVDTYDKIQGTRMGKGYFITRDGKLIDISDEFGGGTNDHVGMFVMESSPELLGIDKKVAARYSEATKKLMGPDYTEWNEEYESEWMEALMDTWNSVYNAKNARVRIFGNNVYIQGNVGLRDV